MEIKSRKTNLVYNIYEASNPLTHEGAILYFLALDDIPSINIPFVYDPKCRCETLEDFGFKVLEENEENHFMKSIERALDERYVWGLSVYGDYVLSFGDTMKELSNMGDAAPQFVIDFCNSNHVYNEGIYFLDYYQESVKYVGYDMCEIYHILGDLIRN